MFTLNTRENTILSIIDNMFNFLQDYLDINGYSRDIFGKQLVIDELNNQVNTIKTLVNNVEWESTQVYRFNTIIEFLEAAIVAKNLTE